MPLDAQIAGFLQQLEAAGAQPFHALPPVEACEAFSKLNAMLPGSSAPVASIDNRSVPGPAGEIPVRVYTPEGDGPFPVLVYIHGGGFVIGSLDDYEPVCQELCSRVGCVVVSVDYRLAPEHPFPAAPDDAFAATQWVAGHAVELNADPARIAVGGDSAGGNLAAVVALRAREAGGPALVGQLLIYPTVQAGEVTPSIEENAEGYLLTRADMEYFFNHYAGQETDLNNPDLAPLRSDNLGGLPPAWVRTCEFDPLRDEGEAYAQALEAAGVPVSARRIDGSIHGSWSFFTVLALGGVMMDEAVEWLKSRFTA